jgi:hypothetical protein
MAMPANILLKLDSGGGAMARFDREQNGSFTEGNLAQYA